MSQAAAKQTVVLITGANKGIGLAFASLFAQRPQHVVYGTARNVAEAVELRKVLGEKRVVQLDVASDASCASLPERIAEQNINVLINNAGVLSRDTLRSKDLIAGSLAQLQTNALGPLRVTQALLPLIKKSADQGEAAKIVNMSAQLASIGENTMGGFYGYRASKAALNALHMCLARDLMKSNIHLLLLHPGYVKTGLTGGRGDMDPATCAKNLAAIIDKSSIESSTKFIHGGTGQTIPW